MSSADGEFDKGDGGREMGYQEHCRGFKCAGMRMRSSLRSDEAHGPNDS